MAATTNDVGVPDITNAAGVSTNITRRTRWALIMAALGKTAIFDRNLGDGTEAEARTRAWMGMGMLGWDGAFLAGDLDYPDTFVLTQEGATARLARATITFSAEAPTATVDAIVYAYDDAGGGGYTDISNAVGSYDPNDLAGDAVMFSYDRPRQTNVIESAATDDMDDMHAIRDNTLAIMCAAFYRGHIHTQYIGIPNATITETPTASLTPTSITVQWLSSPDSIFKYEFTYYQAHLFGDSVTRPRRVTMSVQKTAGQGYFVVATHEYVYKSNGMLFMTRAV